MCQQRFARQEKQNQESSVGRHAPENENNLGALAIGASVILKVENSVAAVVGRKISDKSVVRSIRSSRLLDDNLVVGHVENNVAILVAKLELIKLSNAVSGNLNTGRLGGLKRIGSATV